jgi:hypothetical protein
MIPSKAYPFRAPGPHLEAFRVWAAIDECT